MRALPAGGASAWSVALRRAAHQLYDVPRVFQDPCAVPLLGVAGAAALARTPRRRERRWSLGLRAFAVARARIAEDALRAAVIAGARQYCILGSGLDTFVYRCPWDELAVLELDRLAVLRWRDRLGEDAGLQKRCADRQEDVDLERHPELLGLLPPSGTPVFFSMLGVAPFLSRAAFRALLSAVRRQGPGSGVVFDYRLPPEAMCEEERQQNASFDARLQRSGESLRTGWTPQEMASDLAGFGRWEDLGQEAINGRLFADRDDGLEVCGEAARLVCAAV